jgi:putative Mn2+ efflux pump MntP
MEIFKTLFGVWMMFLGLMIIRVIPSIPVSWEMVGGSFLLVIGLSVLNEALTELIPKPKRSKK